MSKVYIARLLYHGDHAVLALNSKFDYKILNISINKQKNNQLVLTSVG